MSYYTSAHSSSFVSIRTQESSTSPSTHRTFCFNDVEETEGGLLRPESGRQLRRSRCLATRHARAAENSRAMVVGIGRLQLTQAGETAFQETMRHRGRYESTVAGRSRRPDDVERRQRRYDLSPHDNRRLFETSQMHSYTEHVRCVIGRGAANRVCRRPAADVADGSRNGISE